MTDLGTPGFGFHPLHGVHEPTFANPPRRPGSVRRTTSIDMTRDAGSLDPVYLLGRARDLWTAHDGTSTEVGSATLSATMELVARVVRHVEVSPPVAAVAHLSGAPAMSGFRAAVLPWQECPGAVASAERIIGMTLSELHFRVRKELHGTSTCTHLNDLLRSVADAESLIERVRAD